MFCTFVPSFFSFSFSFLSFLALAVIMESLQSAVWNMLCCHLAFDHLLYSKLLLLPIRSLLKSSIKANYLRMTIHVWMNLVPLFMGPLCLHRQGQVKLQLLIQWDQDEQQHGLVLGTPMMGILGIPLFHWQILSWVCHL